MKLSEKILEQRKRYGLSQEDLAEKLCVSRQTISRWEMGSAMPDASNLLQLSDLFGVSADYLLHEDYLSDQDLPKVQEVKKDQNKLIFVSLLALEAMAFLIQFLTVFVLQSAFFGGLSSLLFLAMIVGFEYGYQKQQKKGTVHSDAADFRKRLYQVTAWLGLYFPIRFLMDWMMTFYPRPYAAIVFECVTLIVYIAAAVYICLFLEKRCSPKE